uniref:Uncharacterized protein n=1 Tax=Anguilla anguilla TaxID=7936 RepID=A0A0E9WIL2_ANGAN
MHRTYQKVYGDRALSARALAAPCSEAVELEVKPLRRPLLLLVQHVLFALLEVLVGHFHPAFSQSHKPRLCADGLDVGPGQVVLGQDEVVQRYIRCHGHAAGVDLEDPPLGLLIWQGELNLPVDSSGSDKGGVQGLDPVRGHDDLDVASRVEAVQLVEQLQHGPLDLALPTRV